MGTRRHRRWVFFVLAAVVVLPALATAHAPEGQGGAPAPFDPELFTGWQTWVHLSVQWGHLLGLPLWLGILVAAWVFRALALETLLFAGWAVLLLQGVTGAYNIEYRAGIPTAPSLMQWPMVGAYDFGQSYTALLGVKQGLYGLAVLVTLLVTALHARRAKGIDGMRLRTGYLAAQIVLGVLIALATSGVLLLHEAADVAPTPVHALGGVMGLEGQPVSPPAQILPEPYRSHALQSISAGWRLIREPRVQVDLVSRFAHLLGFGLWLGGLVVATVHRTVPLGRFLAYSWLWLGVQLLSGIVQMAVATPFALPPYVWNLEALHHIRFGWTYIVLMSIKHGLVLGVVAVTGLLTWRSRVAVHRGEVSKAVTCGWCHAANLALGLAIAWVMVMLGLVHQGVDHAL